MAPIQRWRAGHTGTRALGVVILIRLYIGAVFLSEDALKFVRPDAQGAGRFDKASIPVPGLVGPLGGVFEIC
ncbi:hypothetical protein [Streptomyces sp. B21-083]|uniref:hypothetical protein n=1 Tax=Streptomyces sp. B21-083 TaxID=3039410 RepID=UPI002FF391E2